MRLVLLLAAITSIAYGDRKKEKQQKKDNPLAHGFSNEINWVPWEQAIGVAKDLNKPIFFLIHKTWCGACKGLKREFASSPDTAELIELSKKFVMVNVEDDDEPEDEQYAPDGGYIPRILFLDTDADPMKTNNEKKYKNHKFFYPLVPQIIDGMKRALVEFKALPKAGKKAKKEKKEGAKQKGGKSKKGKRSTKEEEEEEEQTEVIEEEDAKDGEKESKSEKKSDSKKGDEKKEDTKKDSKDKDTERDRKKESKQEKKKEEKSSKKDDKKKTDKDRKKDEKKDEL